MTLLDALFNPYSAIVMSIASIAYFLGKLISEREQREPPGVIVEIDGDDDAAYLAEMLRFSGIDPHAKIGVVEGRNGRRYVVIRGNGSIVYDPAASALKLDKYVLTLAPERRRRYKAPVHKGNRKNPKGRSPVPFLRSRNMTNRKGR